MKRLSIHHLIPRQYTKRKKAAAGQTIDICSACHRQIHAFFENKRLAQELNTIETLKNEPQMQKFLLWVSKQNPDRRLQVHCQK